MRSLDSVSPWAAALRPGARLGEDETVLLRMVAPSGPLDDVTRALDVLPDSAADRWGDDYFVPRDAASSSAEVAVPAQRLAEVPPRPPVADVLARPPVAEACPRPVAPVRRPAVARTVPVGKALGVVAAVAVGVAATGWYLLGGSDRAGADSASVAVVRPQGTGDATALGGPTSDGPIRDGAVQFVVTETACGRATVGDRGPQATGQYCVATVEVSNTGSEQRVFDASYQWGVDGAGKRHVADTTAGLYANHHGETFLRALPPGASVTGVLVFDLPAGQQLTSLELHESPDSPGVTVTN